LRTSVIMATCNGGPYLREQLESILNQQPPPDEVVVCDDRSEDGTADLLEESSRRHPSLHFQVNPQRLGVVKNFEKGTELATGEILFFSDQDDVWLPGRLEAMLEPFAADPQVQMVCCDARIVDSDLRPLGQTLFEACPGLRAPQNRTPAEVLRDLGYRGSTMALRAGLRPLVLPFPVGTYWYHDNWLALVAHCFGEVRAVDRPLMLYRRHQGTSSVDPRFEWSLARWVREWLRPRSAESLRMDLETWTVTARRLEELQTRTRGVHLDEYVAESRRRLELARFREALIRTPRLRRLLPVLRRWRSGDYHRYMSGTRTAVKDLLG